MKVGRVDQAFLQWILTAQTVSFPKRGDASVGMGRPTTSLSLRPRPSQWGDPVGLLPPKKRQVKPTQRYRTGGMKPNYQQIPRVLGGMGIVIRVPGSSVVPGRMEPVRGERNGWGACGKLPWI
ncbi:hypothetical protein QL285_036335 [Trifolium repens]|nr:hypothetical protein QL285_036335 [Trifolium repens]